MVTLFGKLMVRFFKNFGEIWQHCVKKFDFETFQFYMEILTYYELTTLFQKITKISFMMYN